MTSLYRAKEKKCQTLLQEKRRLNAKINSLIERVNQLTKENYDLQNKANSYYSAYKTTAKNAKAWKNTAYYIASETYVGGSTGHYIMAKAEDLIMLEDNSVWQVEPIDKYTILTWVLYDDINLSQSGDILYPYQLVNDNEAVKAKYIGKYNP